MIIVLIYAVILIVSLWVMCMQDAISRWIDEADFEEEEQQHDDSGYDWRDNIKGYKKDEQDL
jgi:hypothetical protein